MYEQIKGTQTDNRKKSKCRMAATCSEKVTTRLLRYDFHTLDIFVKTIDILNACMIDLWLKRNQQESCCTVSKILVL